MNPLARARNAGQPLSSKETSSLRVILGLCILTLAIAALLGAIFHGTTTKLIDDPSEGGAENYPAWEGAISYFGVMAWTIGAALAVNGATVAGLRNPAGRFLLRAGILTAVMGLDDLFRFHEHVGFLIPEGEQLCQLIYGVAGIAIVWTSRDFLLRYTPVIVLIGAAAGLGGSAFVDSSHFYVPKAFFVEDALKFIGIVLWAAYLGIIAHRICLAGTAGRRLGDRLAYGRGPAGVGGPSTLVRDHTTIRNDHDPVRDAVEEVPVVGDR
jgi:hypothetical protein